MPLDGFLLLWYNNKDNRGICPEKEYKMNALLWPNHSSITIFGMEIYWYAIIIVFGMMAAFFVISLLFRRRNMSTDLVLTYFVICLPIAIIPTNSYFGLTLGSWITFGFIFALIAFLVGFSFYKLYLLNILLQKEIICLTSNKKNVFTESKLLFKKILKVFLIIFLSLTAGLVTVSILEENNVFLEIEQFATTEEFIEEDEIAEDGEDA